MAATVNPARAEQTLDVTTAFISQTVKIPWTGPRPRFTFIKVTDLVSLSITINLPLSLVAVSSASLHKTCSSCTIIEAKNSGCKRVHLFFLTNCDRN